MRRAGAAKREVLPDPKYGSRLVAKFVNIMMIRGKKSTAERIMYDALATVEDKTKQEIISFQPLSDLPLDVAILIDQSGSMWGFPNTPKPAKNDEHDHRIGQTKNVLVHKFVCRGTVEEKIDELIESKRQLSEQLLEKGADLLLTELNDEELLKLVALDINKAMKES